MYAAANLEVASLRCATRKRVFVAAVSQPALAHEYVLDLGVGIDLLYLVHNFHKWFPSESNLVWICEKLE